MFRTYATALLFSVALAALPAHASTIFSLGVTVSNTQGFNGVDSAKLSLSKGKLTGSVVVISPGGTYPCTVNSGSTLAHHQLNLTCTIGREEMVTLSGRLNSRTGIGKGSFSETFFKETGTYTSAKGN